MGPFVVSPCSNPQFILEQVLEQYAALGFTQLELFTSWAKSAVDYKQEAASYLDKAERYGMRFHSMHLPIVTGLDATLDDAVTAAEFAAALGVQVVLFKADKRETYIRTAGSFLDRTGHLPLVPVLQNHSGTAISTLADFREVLAGIGDPRMRTLLEVGHFHTQGVSWREGYDLLGESIALVHVKDQIGAQSVPFGTGEIDIKGLLNHMASVGYEGRYVIEMEVEDAENTLQYLRDALHYMVEHRKRDKLNG
jgi:sugar phosphate isomerase/epimerase